MEQWNGVSFMSLFSLSPPTIIIETDEAGSWRARAVWDWKWFQVACINDCEKHANIATLELIPIVMAAAVGDSSGKGRQSFADATTRQWSTPPQGHAETQA